MQVRISPSKLSGKYTPPASKSFAHRLLIASALADSPTEVEINCISDDVSKTAGALTAMGAGVKKTEKGFLITPIGGNIPSEKVTIDCGESGSTLRFFIPIASALGIKAEFVGRGRLGERPIGSIIDAIGKGRGVEFLSKSLPLNIEGKLSQGDYSIVPAGSSQFISGLMFALSYLGGSKLNIVGERVSEPYIKITEQVLKYFNLEYQTTDCGYSFPNYCKYISPKIIACPVDLSQASFFAVASAIGGKIDIKGIPQNSCQGDIKVFDILHSCGVVINRSCSSIEISAGEIKPFDVSVRDIPDSAPILSVLGAYAGGTSVLRDVERLRIKESDRLQAIMDMLSAFGIICKHEGDALFICGGRPHGGIINGSNDHRIVMASAICACYAEGDSVITDAEAVNKSYPGFFDDFASLGGKYDRI